MYLVTNRNVTGSQDDLKKLGPKPNPKGPNELRLARATKKATGWKVEVLRDKLDNKMKKEVGIKSDKTFYASHYVARKLIKDLQKKKRNLLFFVHGFNNDLKAVLDRAHKLEKNFNVEVVPFSWPANGGGVKGIASYKSDKRDARASVGALDRCFGKLFGYLEAFNEERVRRVCDEAEKKYPDNIELRDSYITEECDRGCPFTVNMLLHSMGNYLFKHVLKSSVYRGNRLLFDNVILASADTNNKDHVEWVNRIQARRRVYITINEDDSVLMASRMKAGQEQLARLGHYRYNLHSNQVAYVSFTGSKHVGNSHAYFEDALKNPQVKKFFQLAINGKRTEDILIYDPSGNLFRFS